MWGLDCCYVGKYSQLLFSTTVTQSSANENIFLRTQGGARYGHLQHRFYFSQHFTCRGYRTRVSALIAIPIHLIRFPRRGPVYRSGRGYRTPVRKKSQLETIEKSIAPLCVRPNTYGSSAGTPIIIGSAHHQR